MTHRRQTIRAAFASAVTGLASTGARVYVSRLYPLQPDELPALRVYTDSDGVEGESIGVLVVPPIRRVRVVCEVVAKANAAADDAVDAACEQLEVALAANPFLGGAVLALRYQGFEQQLSVDGDQQVTDEVIARIERAVLRGRLTTEQAADRIALLQANIAIVDAREVRAQRIQARDVAIAAVLAADAARDALVAERDAQQAIRADAIAQLATLTGAARLPVVAVRDAAVDELARIVPLLTEANAAIAVARDARDAAVAALVAANAEIASLRAARDALLAG